MPRNVAAAAAVHTADAAGTAAAASAAAAAVPSDAEDTAVLAAAAADDCRPDLTDPAETVLDPVQSPCLEIHQVRHRASSDSSSLCVQVGLLPFFGQFRSTAAKSL